MSKKKLLILEEVKKARLDGDQKDIKKVLNKYKEEKDLQNLCNLIEIENLNREEYIPEGFEASKKFYEEMIKVKEITPEIKEITNVSAYFYCLFALAFEQDLDTLKILTNIKDEPTTDPVITAIKSTWAGMYIDIRGLLGDSYLKQKDLKNAYNSYNELFSQIQNFGKLMETLDGKTLYSLQKRIIGLSKVLLLQG